MTLEITQLFAGEFRFALLQKSLEPLPVVGGVETGVALVPFGLGYRPGIGEAGDEFLVPAGGERRSFGDAGGRRPGLVLDLVVRNHPGHQPFRQGFAGGLRSELAAGTIVFAADEETGLESALLAAGARPARFHCVERVATTAEQKRALLQVTGADAVEMESQIICGVCREARIPSATVRVILDAANEDLPIDFNELMTSDQVMSYGKLAMLLAKSPGKVGALRRLQQESKAAAERLAQVLASLLFPQGRDF